MSNERIEQQLEFLNQVEELKVVYRRNRTEDIVAIAPRIALDSKTAQNIRGMLRSWRSYSRSMQTIRSLKRARYFSASQRSRTALHRYGS